MSSRPNDYPRASAVLASLGLTSDVAAAATDNIPIAKLVLGVVSRIITLAQDIEKNRDALHELAESARTMGLKIPAVVSGRQLSPEIERSLKTIYDLLCSIQSVLEKHKAKNAFHKALSYAFTTSKRIGSLSQELSRATQELLWVAALDTNAQVRENSRYIGEYRRIRLCEIDERKLIAEHEHWTGHSCQIYSGSFEGKAIVLRFLKQKAGHTCGEWYRRRVTEHDRLLEELSTDPSLHRNIARLYGRNAREHFDRFNVMNSEGSRISQFDEHPATIESTWNTISQLVDAACWLEDRGLCWDPDTADAVFIDHAGAPIIGLHNDLSSCDMKWWHIRVLRLMLERTYSAHWTKSQPGEHALDTGFATGLAPKGIYREKITVPRRLIPTMDAKISTYIRNALQSLRNPYEFWGQTGAVILHASASGCTVGSASYAQYFANFIRRPLRDELFMARVDESDTELVHWTVSADVPTSMTETFRKKLGITVDGPPNLAHILESFRDPAEPASMQFTPFYLR